MRYQSNSPVKEILISAGITLAAAALVIGGIFLWKQNKNRNTVVEVQQVHMLSTMYWGDQSTSYGVATSDFVQELYPDMDTSISEIYVSEGQEVKIGDVLLQYDTTRMQLNLESKDLELQKKQHELYLAKKELTKLQNTKPYIEPVATPVPTPVPVPESTAILYTKLDAHSKPYSGTGTTEDPYVFLCTEDCVLTKDFMLRLFGMYSEPTAEPTAAPGTPLPTPTAGPTASPEQPAEPTPTAAPSATPAPETVTADEDDTEHSPTVSPEPTPAPAYTLPAGPFAARFEVHEDNNEYLPMIKGWALDGTVMFGGFLAELKDDVGIDSDTGEDSPVIEIPAGMSFYTAAELKEMIEQQKQLIKDLELAVKQADIDLQKAKMELSNATVVSSVNGIVKTLTDLETAMMDGSPFLVVSGGSGFYVEGTINEGLLGQLNVGDTISVSAWEIGATLTAEIVKISDYPITSGDYWDGVSNPNSSSYSFTAYIPEAEGLKNGMWLDIFLQPVTENTVPEDTLYLSKAYIRSDEYGRYVMKAGEDKRIHKTYIQTGKTIYSEYMELKGDTLTGEDYIAFPYGDGAIDGAKADLPEDVMMSEEVIPE